MRALSRIKSNISAPIFTRFIKYYDWKVNTIISTPLVPVIYWLNSGSLQCSFSPIHKCASWLNSYLSAKCAMAVLKRQAVAPPGWTHQTTWPLKQMGAVRHDRNQPEIWPVRQSCARSSVQPTQTTPDSGVRVSRSDARRVGLCVSGWRLCKLFTYTFYVTKGFLDLSGKHRSFHSNLESSTQDPDWLWASLTGSSTIN